MGRRLLTRWETLPARRQILVSAPLLAALLYLFHHAFPLLDWKERVTYALMECVPLALLVTWATQNELRRRQERNAAEQASTDDP